MLRSVPFASRRYLVLRIGPVAWFVGHGLHIRKHRLPAADIWQRVPCDDPARFRATWRKK